MQTDKMLEERRQVEEVPVWWTGRFNDGTFKCWSGTLQCLSSCSATMSNHRDSLAHQVEFEWPHFFSMSLMSLSVAGVGDKSSLPRSRYARWCSVTKYRPPPSVSSQNFPWVWVVEFCFSRATASLIARRRRRRGYFLPQGTQAHRCRHSATWAVQYSPLASSLNSLLFWESKFILMNNRRPCLICILQNTEFLQM